MLTPMLKACPSCLAQTCSDLVMMKEAGAVMDGCDRGAAMVHHRLRHLYDASPLTDSGGEDTERVSAVLCKQPDLHPCPLCTTIQQFSTVCFIFTKKSVFL